MASDHQAAKHAGNHLAQQREVVLLCRGISSRDEDHGPEQSRAFVEYGPWIEFLIHNWELRVVVKIVPGDGQSVHRPILF
jgi:hypothetical protein